MDVEIYGQSAADRAGRLEAAAARYEAAAAHACRVGRPAQRVA
jgi:hypothetical protein